MYSNNPPAFQRSQLTGAPGTDLESLNTYALETGCGVWVESENDLFYLVKTSTATPVAGQVVQPVAGPGRWLRYSTSASRVASELVYDPLGSGPSGANVFTDFEALYQTFLVTPGFVQVYFVDTCTVPPRPGGAAYGWQNRTQWIGPIGTSTQQRVLTLAEGNHHHDLHRITSLQIVGDATTVPPLHVHDDSYTLLDLGTSIRTNAGKVPCMAIDSTLNGLLVLGLGGEIHDRDGGGPSIVINTGKALGLLVLGPLALVYNDSISGGAAETLQILFSNDGSTVGGQALFTGTFGIQLMAIASSEQFSPTNPGDWAAPPPDNVDSALNRVAAAVAGLLGGPIP